MRRLFWVGLGAAVGVLVVRKASRVAHGYTPAGIGESAGAHWRHLRELIDTVREGMATREVELREALLQDAEHRRP